VDALCSHANPHTLTQSRRKPDGKRSPRRFRAYVATVVEMRELISLRDTSTPLLTDTAQLGLRIALIALLLGRLGVRLFVGEIEAASVQRCHDGYRYFAALGFKYAYLRTNFSFLAE
jgi:hypothetical protein